MRLVVHKEIPADPALRRQWDGLVQQMEEPAVFFTYEWALAVSRAYSSSLAPLLLLAYEKDCLVGVAALAADASKQETVFLAGTTADYCDFICDPARRGDFLGLVLARLRELNIKKLRLANLPGDSATASAIKDPTHNQGYWVFSRSAYLCARVTFQAPEDRSAILESAQRRTRRYAQDMRKKGAVKFRHCTSWPEISAQLPSFAKAHVARFLATGRISNLARPERRRFLEELAHALSVPGWVTLSQTVVDEKVIAWNYGFQFGGSWFYYLPTFDTNFHKFSPGLWLLSEIVEEACAMPQLDVVDLGLGAEGYKERLATGTRETLHVTAALSVFSSWKEKLRHGLATAVCSAPWLENRVRGAVGNLDAVRKQIRSNSFWGFTKIVGNACKTILRSESASEFWEWSASEFAAARPADSHTLAPLDLDLLAAAAMQYSDDRETLGYLLRACRRLGRDEFQGFALINGNRMPLHFCWVAGCETVDPPEFQCEKLPPDSGMIADCWTPHSIRGRGYYSEAITGVAQQLQRDGKRAWLSIEPQNRPALGGAEKAGFARRFSLLRRRVLFTRTTIESRTSALDRAAIEASAAA